MSVFFAPSVSIPFERDLESIFSGLAVPWRNFRFQLWAREQKNATPALPAAKGSIQNASLANKFDILCFPTASIVVKRGRSNAADSSHLDSASIVNHHNRTWEQLIVPEGEICAGKMDVEEATNMTKRGESEIR